MKKIEYSYTHKEVVEIIQAAKILIERLRLPGFEDGVPLAVPEVAPPPKRAYHVDGTRTPEKHVARGGNGACPKCDAPMEPSKYAGGKPWCFQCWSAKKDGK